MKGKCQLTVHPKSKAKMKSKSKELTSRSNGWGYAKTDVSFQTKYFVQKELDIRGSRNAMPSDFRAVIHYLERGTCPVDKFISMECSPEEAPLAMEKWVEAPGKVFRILVKNLV